MALVAGGVCLCVGGADRIELTIFNKYLIRSSKIMNVPIYEHNIVGLSTLLMDDTN